MRKLIVVSFCALSLSVFGQSKADTYMNEIFGEEKVQLMKTDNPAGYNFFKSYAMVGPSIENGIIDKYENAPVLTHVKMRTSKEEVPVSQMIEELENGTLNPLKYSLLPKREVSVYKIESGKYLIIDSQDNLLKHITE